MDALFSKYILGTILATYRDFDKRNESVSEKLPAMEAVRRPADGKSGKFTMIDSRVLYPTLGKTSMESSIKKMVNRGVLIKHGAGKDLSLQMIWG